MKPCIVILNSSSFGKRFPEHVSRLESFAEVRRVDLPQDVDPDTLTQHLVDAHGIIASVTPKITQRTLQQLPKLVVLARHGIGCDNVDLEAATELGIPVSRVAGEVERNAVAEIAVALLLAAGRYLPQAGTEVRESRWQSRSRYLGLEVSGKKIGIIGIGNIGSRFAEIMKQGFGSDVLAYDPNLSKEVIALRFARSATLDELLSTSDVVSLHCSLNPSSYRLLTKERIALLRKNVVLVNTCRGELLDEDALFEALKNGKVGSYATDVVEGEPIDGKHRLLQLGNVIVIPHLGGYTHESLGGMGQTMVDDMEQTFLKATLPKTLANPMIAERRYRTWR